LRKVRSGHMKNLARMVIERFPKRFDYHLENSEKMMDALTNMRAPCHEATGYEDI
jgi:ribosomal protein S17E